MESQLIAASVADRTAYEFLESKNIREDLSPVAQIIFDVIGDYYEKDQRAEVANKDLLLEAIRQEHPKHVDSLGGVLEDLPAITSAPNTVELWLSAKRKAVGNDLAAALVNNRDPRVVDELMESYHFYQSYEEEPPTTYVGVHPKEFFEGEAAEQIPFAPEALDRFIGGGVERKHHVVVFGVPEIGKSQTLINAMCVQAQRGYKVLYLDNEDTPKDMVSRILSRMSDIPNDEMRARYNEAYDIAVTKGYNNIVIQEIRPGTLGEIRDALEEHKPDVLYVDQIVNLSIAGCDGNYTRTLRKAGIAMRNFGKVYDCIAVSVTQAGDSAQGRAVIHYSDIEYSRIGMGASMDLAIGVGATEEMYNQNKLCLTISKNKLNGRHGSVMARVSRQLSKLKSDV